MFPACLNHMFSRWPLTNTHNHSEQVNSNIRKCPKISKKFGSFFHAFFSDSHFEQLNAHKVLPHLRGTKLWKLESTADKLFAIPTKLAVYKAEVIAAEWNKFRSKQAYHAHKLVNAWHVQKKLKKDTYMKCVKMLKTEVRFVQLHIGTKNSAYCIS